MKNLLIATTLIVTSFSLSFAQSELSFEANGEDFVRQGFVSKDGWQIDFEHAFVNLFNIRAYQTDPPFEAESELTGAATMVGLAGAHYLDLAAGDANAAPILIGSSAASEGFYNALSWQMRPDDANPTLRLEGTASKDGERIDFVIESNDIFEYHCGTFIGDERKGIVTADDNGVVELTFHFDHIFGDEELDVENSLNEGALGFAPFASIAEGGSLELGEPSSQLAEEDYRKLSSSILPNLGHVGEGHCFERHSAANP